MDVIWLALVFMALLALRCPVAYAMILSSAVSLWMSGLPLLNISQKLASGVDSFPLLAIPLFILAGSLMNTLGITERIFGLASALVGHIPGGLAHVNVVASVIFAGMSGSAIADAGGLGAVEMKAMNDAGYPRDVSAAITAASATIGPVVPPSIAMVIYAFIAEQSLGALFLVGIFPGLLMAALMMLLIYVASKRGHYDLPALPRASRIELGSAFRRAFLPLLAPAILVGGILFGIFTPTEAGVVVVVYVLVVGVVFLKFELGHIRDAMMDTVRTSAATLFIIAASTIFGWHRGLPTPDDRRRRDRCETKRRWRRRGHPTRGDSYLAVVLQRRRRDREVSRSSPSLAAQRCPGTFIAPTAMLPSKTITTGCVGDCCQ